MRLFTRLTLMSLTVLMFGTVSLQAQYVEAFKIDKASKDHSDAQVFTVMSTHLGVPSESLKAQKSESGLDMGQLYIANALARATKSDVKALLSENKTKSWGQIAKEKNVKMKDIENDVDKLEKDLNALAKTAAVSKKGLEAQTK